MTTEKGCVRKLIYFITHFFLQIQVWPFLKTKLGKKNSRGKLTKTENTKLMCSKSENWKTREHIENKRKTKDKYQVYSNRYLLQRMRFLGFFFFFASIKLHRRPRHGWLSDGNTIGSATRSTKHIQRPKPNRLLCQRPRLLFL